MVPARFAVATHILLLLATAQDKEVPGSRGGIATSVWLAERVHTNSVVVRRLSGRLARAGLLHVRRGSGGAALARPPEAITLEDVWLALHDAHRQPLLPLHAGASGSAAEGAQTVLAGAFAQVEAAFRAGLRNLTLHDLVGRMNAG